MPLFASVATAPRYDDAKFEETLKLCDESTRYALTGAVFAQDRRAVRRMAEVLEHTAGKPVREGGGDETHRCGACKTKLMINVAHRDVHGVVIQCGKCGRLNTEAHHHHH